MNDREIPGVGKSLHIEEIQSDWHQAGRKQGYANPEKFTELNKQLENARSDLQEVSIKSAEQVLGMSWAKYRREHPGDGEALAKLQKARESMLFYQDAENKVKRLEEERSKYTSTIPNAPFKKTWDELTIKRMIKEAADNGYDAISWTPGEAQAARYDLSKQLANCIIKIEQILFPL